MKRLLAPLCCLLLSSCVLFQRYPRPQHAPVEEAAAIEFPLGIPTEGRQRVAGVTLKAIQLAMDDFLPWDVRVPRDADAQVRCLYQRESYDVFTSPGPDGVLFVSVIPNPERCLSEGAPVLDVSATYAVDVRGWRILSVRQ